MATYFGARYYNARLGRFMSPDPLTIHGHSGDLNPYAYVRGRVLSHVDPHGLSDTAVNEAASSQAGPVASSGSYVQPDNGTVVTWTWDGSYGTGDLGGRTPGEVLELVQGLVGDGHIPLGNGNYFRPNGVAEVGQNAVKGVVLDALDPGGLRRFTKLMGWDIDAAVMSSVGDGPKDRSQLVGSAVVVVGALVAGKLLSPAAASAADGVAAAEGAAASGATAAEEGFTTLYRTVSEAEKASVNAAGAYTPPPSGLGGKYFYPTAEQAAKLAKVNFPSQGVQTLTSVRVPNSVLGGATRLHIGGEGAGYFFEAGQLQQLGTPAIWLYFPLP